MINANKALYCIEISSNCIKYTKMTKSKKMSKSNQKLTSEYFIPTKFSKHSPSDSVAKADYVFQYIYMH